MYGMFEGFYFPNFWDFAIYLMLFIKKEPQIELPVNINANSTIVASNNQQWKYLFRAVRAQFKSSA